VTNIQSSNNVYTWIENIQHNANTDNYKIIIVGNKLDLLDMVVSDRNLNFDNNIHIYTSAKTNVGIQELFDIMSNMTECINVPIENKTDAISITKIPSPVSYSTYFYSWCW